MRTIIGIDPGSRYTGYGVIGSSTGSLELISQGVIHLKDTFSFAEKLHELSKQLYSLLVAHQPDDVVIEDIFLGKNVDSAFKLGHVRGVCMQHIPQFDCNFYEYAARTVKKSITGNGGAEKEHVALIIKQLLNIKEDCKTDASDALALAVCHASKAEQEHLMNQQLQGAR